MVATIRKRGLKWQVQIRRRGVNSLNRSFMQRSDAVAWASQIELSIDRRGLPAKLRDLRQLTLGSLIDRYLLEITPTKRGAAVETCRMGLVRRHAIASISLDQLSAADFARFRDDRLQAVSPETVRRDLGTLHHVLEIARDEWRLDLGSNPVSIIRWPRTNLARSRRLKEEEYRRLEVAIMDTRNKVIRPLMMFAIETGMRRGELLAARWADLDVQRSLLIIRTTKNGHPRVIPLSSRAIAVLEDVRGLDPTAIFPTTGNAVRLAWSRLTGRAGIEDLHFHDLRHEAISRLFERGLGVAEVATISGHRDFRMLARYTHLRAEDLVHKLS